MPDTYALFQRLAALRRAHPALRRGSFRTILAEDAIVAYVREEEGGDAVVAAFDAAGCRRVRLGPRVLRTETAGLAAVAALQARWGDF